MFRFSPSTLPRFVSLVRRIPVVFALSGLLLAITVAGLSIAGTSYLGGTASAGPGLECPVPVDVSLVLDHSGSMGTPASKLTNAKSAAIGFIDQLAGGPLDNDLTPHHVALTSFTNGTAATNVALTTNAATLRTTINGFSAAGFTEIGRAIQLGQLQLEPPVDSGDPPPDYMVLLTDGSANEPQDIDSGNVTDQFYIDVNNNGYVDTGDDISVNYTGNGDQDFVVVDGLLQIAGGTQAARDASRLNAFDTNEDGVLNNSDDYNFGAGFNFRVIDGTLYLDANGDGNFTVDPANGPNPVGTPAFQLGHNDELAVLRNGMVWSGTSDYSGDGSDVYADYWATQTKLAGTKIFVVGYDIGSSQDSSLLQLMSSGPAYYFGGAPSNVGSIFNSIAQAICGFSLQKVRTSNAQAYPGDKVTFSITLSNTGSLDLQDVNLHDHYDPSQLTLVSALPAPTTTNLLTGDLDWTSLAHDPPDLDPTVWEPGAMNMIQLSFIAKVPIAEADNCANLTSHPVGDPGTTVSAGPSCDSVSVITPTVTQTPVTPFPTATSTRTATPTSTDTPVPPTDTPTTTSTDTPVPPTATATNTPVPPTATASTTPTPLAGTVVQQGSPTPTRTPGGVGGVAIDPYPGGSGGGTSVVLIALAVALGVLSLLGIGGTVAVRVTRRRS